MADAFHEVVYRAVADFSAVVREAAKTRAELAALNKDIENFNRNSSSGVSRGVPGNTAQNVRTATQALKDQNAEFERHSTAVRGAGRDLEEFTSKSRTLLNKHTDDLRAAGKEFQAFNDKYTQRGFDGLGEKALRNLNNVAGRMREVVRQHQEELKRLTEGRDFKFDERPGRVTQPGLFPETGLRGERGMTGRVEHSVRDTAETKANTSAINANTSAVLANAAAREKAEHRRQAEEIAGGIARGSRDARGSLIGDSGAADYQRLYGDRGGFHEEQSQEGRALRLYQGSAYDIANQIQRGQQTFHGERAESTTDDDVHLFKNMIRSIERAFESERAQLQENLNLYRGVFSHPDRALPSTPGSLIHDPAFQSTSLDRDTAEDFARGSGGTEGRENWVKQLLEIQARRGQQGIPLNGMSEAEVLLRRGQYRVTGSHIDDEGIQRIQAQYLTDDEFEEERRRRAREQGEEYDSSASDQAADRGSARSRGFDRGAKIWASQYLRQSHDRQGRLTGQAGYDRYLYENPALDPAGLSYDDPRAETLYGFQDNERQIQAVQRGRTPEHVTGDDQLAQIHRAIADINERFASGGLNLRNNFALYRRQDVDPADAYPTTPGALIDDPSFQRLRADRENVEFGADRATDNGQIRQILEVIARRGEPALPLSNYGGPHGGDASMLVQRGRYRVLGSETDDQGVQRIQAEQLTEEEFAEALKEQAKVLANAREDQDNDRNRRPAEPDTAGFDDYFGQLAAQQAALFDDDERGRISRDAKLEVLDRDGARRTPSGDTDRAVFSDRAADSFGHRVGELICEHLKKCFEDNVAPLLGRADGATPTVAQRPEQEREDEELKHQRRSNRIERDTHRSLSGEAVSQAGERSSQERIRTAEAAAKALSAEEKLTEQTHRTAGAQERLNQELLKTASLRERAEQAAANTLITEEKLNRAVHETAVAQERARQAAERADREAANTLVTEERLNRAVHETATARSRSAVAAENAEQAAARTLVAEERVNQAVHGTEVARNRSLVSQENAEQAAARTLTAEERLQAAAHATEVSRHRALQSSERTDQAAARTLISEEGLHRATLQSEIAQHNTASARERSEQAAARTLIAEENLTQATSRSAIAEERRLQALGNTEIVARRLEQIEERNRHQRDTHAGQELLLEERLAATARRRQEAEEVAARRQERASRRPTTFREAISQAAGRLVPYNESLVNRREVDRDLGLLGRVRNAFREVREARTAAGGGGGGGGAGGALLGAAGNLGENIGNSLGKASTRLITMRGLIVAMIASLGPLIAALGALGAAAIGAGNALISMGGAVLALPGLLAAAAAGIGALIVAFKPVSAVFKAYQAAQKASIKSTQDSKDALKEERDAQTDLNDARRQALRDLQDLATAVSRASLDEEGAILNLRRAQADYRKTLASPDSTLLDREEALHRVKVAENDLADVRLRNTRNAEDLAAAEKLGVDGSKSVQSALERLATAQKNAAAGSSAAATANAEYQRVLALLGPNARAVTLAVLGQADAWKELQKYVGEQLFAPLVGQMGKLPILLKSIRGLLGEAGAAVGGVLAKGLAMVTSGPWTADFATISKQNAGIITSLGDAALSVASAFRHITIAAGPFTQWVGAAIARVADNFDRWAKAGRESGSIADFLETTKLRLQQMGQILGNVFSLFKSLFFASSDFTGDFMEALVKVTERWAAFGKTTERDGSKFKKYLEDVKPLLKVLAGFLKAVAVAFVQIAADPANIQEASKLFTVLSRDVLPGLVRFFTSLSRSDAISNIVEAIGQLLEAVTVFLESGGATALEGFFGTLLLFAKAMTFLSSLGPVPHILGAIAIAFGALAAASVIGRFSGLFAILAAFKWLMANRGNLTGALLDRLGGGANTVARSGTQAASELEKGKLVGVYTGQLNTIIGLLQRIAACTCSDAADPDGTIIPGGKKSKVNLAKGATVGLADDVAAGAAGAGAGGFLARTAGRLGITGGVAANVGRFAKGASLLAIPGLITGLAADAGVFGGKGSAGKQLGQAGGAVLTGAGIGAGIGSVVPVIGTAVGAVVGAIVGGLYSIAKDAGLRKLFRDTSIKVGDWIYYEIAEPIGKFFLDIGVTIGGFLYEWVVKPVSDAFSSLGKFFSGLWSKFINSAIYQKVIRPILAIIIGLQNAVVDAMQYVNGLVGRAFRYVGTLIGGIRIAALGWIKDHIITPFLRTFRYIGTLIATVRIAALGLIDEYLIQPLMGVFRYINDLTLGVRTAINDWIYKWLVAPVVGFFRAIAVGAFGLAITAQGWVNEHIGAPILKFFLGIAEFLGNLPTIVERQLEKIPGVGKYIADAYRQLGVGTEISGTARRLKFSGGLVEGPRDGRVDTIDARLTAGEFITRRRIVDKPYVKQLLDDLNNDRFDPAQFYAGLNGMSLSSVPTASMNRMVISPQSMTVSTVNNHGKGDLSFGDITINNPVREKSDRSLRRTLQNAAHLHNR